MAHCSTTFKEQHETEEHTNCYNFEMLNLNTLSFSDVCTSNRRLEVFSECLVALALQRQFQQVLQAEATGEVISGGTPAYRCWGGILQPVHSFRSWCSS